MQRGTRNTRAQTESASTSQINGTTANEGSLDGADSGDDSTSTNSDLIISKSLAQAEKALKGASEEDIDLLVNELVMYMLIMDRKKQPIKRQDISKVILKEHKRGYAVIFEKASNLLKMVFGIRVIKLEDQNRYILVNNLERCNGSKDQIWPPLENAKTGLVMFILALIFMRGNSLSEDEVFEALRKFGVDVDQQHEVFGDIRKLVLTEFVRHGYLETVRQVGVEQPKMNLIWGHRALAETTKRDILDFVCTVYGTEDPSYFRSQYRDAMESE